jgi:hypothetical protein
MRRIVMTSLVGWLAITGVGQAQRGGKPGCQAMAGGGQTHMMSRMMGSGGFGQAQMVPMTGGNLLQAQMFPRFPMAGTSFQTPTGGNFQQMQTPAHCGKFSQSQMMTRGPKTGGSSVTQAQLFPMLQTMTPRLPTTRGNITQAMTFPTMQTTGGGSFTQALQTPVFRMTGTGTEGRSQQTSRPCSKTVAMSTPQIMIPQIGFPGTNTFTQSQTNPRTTPTGSGSSQLQLLVPRTSTTSGGGVTSTPLTGSGSTALQTMIPTTSTTGGGQTATLMNPNTRLPASASTALQTMIPRISTTSRALMSTQMIPRTNISTTGPGQQVPPGTYLAQGFCAPTRARVAELTQHRTKPKFSLFAPTSTTSESQVTTTGFAQSQTVPQTSSGTTTATFTQAQMVPQTTARTRPGIVLVFMTPRTTTTRLGGDVSSALTSTASSRSQRVCPSAGGSYVLSSSFPTASAATATSGIGTEPASPQNMQSMIDQSLQPVQANIDQMSQTVALNTVATLNSIAQTQRHLYVLMMLENYPRLARSQRATVPVAMPMTATADPEDADAQTSPAITQSAAVDLGCRSLALPAW